MCAAGFLVVVCCGLLPHATFYAGYGRGPLTRAQFKAWTCIEGKTREEVLEQMGKPHNTRNDRAVWDYTRAGRQWHDSREPSGVVSQTRIARPEWQAAMREFTFGDEQLAEIRRERARHPRPRVQQK